MQTFAQSLIELVISGEVDREVAANAATNRHDFIVDLERAEKNAAADRREAELPPRPRLGLSADKEPGLGISSARRRAARRQRQLDTADGARPSPERSDPAPQARVTLVLGWVRDFASMPMTLTWSSVRRRLQPASTLPSTEVS